MSIIDLFKQPWFYRSPSPYTLAYWAIMALWGSIILLRHGAEYKWFPRFFAILDALFIFGIIILVQDTIWLTCNTVRWFGEYVGEMELGYWIRFPQNLVGIIFCFLIVHDKWKQGYFRFKFNTVLGFLAYSMFWALICYVAPNPSLTDWTYAIRFGFSDQRIYEAFVLSHIIGKSIVAIIFYTVWNGFKPRKCRAIAIMKGSTTKRMNISRKVN